MQSIFLRASELFEKSISSGIDRIDMEEILNWPVDQISVLFACADQVRRHFHGNTVDPCSLMNIKAGGCPEDCAFCAQSDHNHTSVTISGLADPEKIKENLENARRHNLPFCVVSSGRRLSRNEIEIITGALKDCQGEKHASLGILDYEEFVMLRDAGVSCYNHNIETCRSFFPEIVSTHTWEHRVETVKNAKKAGMKVCCGGILGLGESREQRIEFCEEIRTLDIDTVPLNFYIPVKGTGISAPKESSFELLKIVSLFRLAMPQRTIKVCGGREYHLGPLQSLIFFSGANGYISGGYLTTSGAGINTDDLMLQKLELVKREAS
jgi:biotin synthase